MPDYRRSAPSFVSSPHVNSLIASARTYKGQGDPIIQKREWQKEAWDFYHAMGEFWYGTTWLSNALSRVRLVAAKLQPGGDEPEILRDDEGADGGSDITPEELAVVRAVEQLAGGVGGQSAMMKSLGVQLSVPGEGFVVGEQRRLGDGSLSSPEWSVKSADEIRRRQSGEVKPNTSTLKRLGGQVVTQSPYEIQIEEGAWRPLGGDSIVCRVWQPDEQLSWRSTSAALPALPILREIDLYNRRIIADLVSRLASNGMLIMPEEATFPVRPEFKDASDPFVAELIDTASSAIRNPGSASAAIPIPVKVPAALVDKFIHLTFASPFDDKVMDARDRAIKRLATTLNMPSEVLLGVADVNHWTAWQIDESGIKIHISPIAEIIVHALTVGYLRPMLEAMGSSDVGADGSRYVVWYDVTELTTKPDLAQNAKDAHSDGTISDAAYRREAGFTEDDAPDDDELKTQLLRFLAFGGNQQAIKELTGLDLAPPPPPGFDPVSGRPLAPELPTGQDAPQGPPSGGANPPVNGKVPAKTGA
jgi:hypothetical protein